MLKSMKDKLYYYFAEKNWGVRREYGPYVDTHQEEHAKQPWKHWWMLIRLNWHYRILRRNDVLFYKQDDKSTANTLQYPESTAFERAEIQEIVDELMKFDVISFDIFDTLVLRPFAEPKDLFDILGVELLMPDFKEIRCRTEAELRRRLPVPNGEISIYDIYEALESHYGIAKDIWCNREIELEQTFCYANPYMKTVYEILRTAGKTMVATSDMYLPQEILKSILDNCGYTEIKEIFCSCDYHCNKKNGQLQNVVKQNMGRHKRYIHVGDNFQSDIKASRAFGWNAFFYQNINVRGGKYRNIRSNSLSASIYTGLVNAKLHCFNSPQEQYYEHGFVYGGILVCGYCQWLNDLARKEKIDKFLFVARDGDVISKIYNSNFFEVPNEYIFASRFALFQSDFEKNIDQFLKGIIYRRANFSKEKKSIQCVLEETDLSFLIDRLSEYNLTEDMLFTESQYEAISDLIFESKSEILLHFDQNRRAALQYMKEIVGESKKICIVDVGWGGNSFRMLRDVISAVTNGQVGVVGTLLATNKNMETRLLEETGELYVYLFSQLKNRDMLQTHRPAIHNLLVEFMFSAPFPSLLKYLLIDDKVKFEFSQFEEDNYFITKEIQRGMIDFSNAYCNIVSKLKFRLNICPYDAFTPLKSVLNNHMYNYKLFKDYNEESLSGIFSDSAKQKTTFGEIMAERNVLNL